MFVTVILIILAIAAFFVVYGLLQSSTFSISRSVELKAPAEEVFAQINDFCNLAAWSPWAKMDPSMQRSFSGADSSEGATYSWAGNKKVGEGNMEIINAKPSQQLELEVNFVKPFQASNITEFTLTPSGASTSLKWEMRGRKPFIIRMMSLFMDLDKMLGKDFAAGLADLKVVVER